MMKSILSLLVPIFVVLWMTAGVQGAPNRPPGTPKPNASPLSASLHALASPQPLTPEQQAMAQSLGVWAGPEHVRVILETDRNIVLPESATLEIKEGFRYQIRLPRTALNSLTNLPGVLRIRPPLPHTETLVFNEGLAPGGFFPWLNSNWNGQGVHIAIIDLGFAGWQDLSASGELPGFVGTRNFRADGHFESTGHGSAVAEIVYDAAPEASLSLFAINTELELSQAVDEAIRQHVDIIVHSISWFNTGPGDGTGVLADIVRKADTAGIVWVAAAGNQAQRYYEGYFTPSPTNPSRHLFADNDEGNDVALQRGQQICGMLSWDAWPTTDDDYDLYLYRDNQWVMRSDDVQNGSQTPTEALCYTADATDTYSFVIVHYSQNYAPVQMRLFVTGANLQYATPAGSLVQPADAPEALAVGAIFWMSPYPLEPFSSLGPTTDGRVKPDLAAYDGLSTVTYGRSNGVSYEQGGTGFFGTSASAPLVAGAAALVKQRFPQWAPSDIRDFLKDWAIDMGAPGPDAQFGAGRLHLPATQPTTTPTATVTPTTTPTPTPTPSPTPSPTPTLTPTPTITPTPTPNSPWLNTYPTVLLPGPQAPQTITILWGNHLPNDQLQVLLNGPVHFPDDSTTLTYQIPASSGSFSTELLIDTSAQPGQSIRMAILSPRVQIQREGQIALTRYLPLYLHPQ